MINKGNNTFKLGEINDIPVFYDPSMSSETLQFWGHDVKPIDINNCEIQDIKFVLVGTRNLEVWTESFKPLK